MKNKFYFAWIVALFITIQMPLSTMAADGPCNTLGQRQCEPGNWLYECQACGKSPCWVLLGNCLKNFRPAPLSKTPAFGEINHQRYDSPSKELQVLIGQNTCPVMP